MDSDDEWEEEEPGESLSDCHSAVSLNSHDPGVTCWVH